MTRYSEMPVKLKHPLGGELDGVQWWDYPVDEPPVVEVNEGPLGLTRLYRSVWEAEGWEISDDTD